MNAWRHQTIAWTNVDWSSVKSNDIHIRVISQAVHQPSSIKICLKITYLKFHLNFPGANELISPMKVMAATATWTKGPPYHSIFKAHALAECHVGYDLFNSNLNLKPIFKCETRGTEWAITDQCALLKQDNFLGLPMMKTKKIHVCCWPGGTRHQGISRHAIFKVMESNVASS